MPRRSDHPITLSCGCIQVCGCAHAAGDRAWCQSHGWTTVRKPWVSTAHAQAEHARVRRMAPPDPEKVTRVKGE